MSHLAPCPDCNRHVAVDEIACPFCAAVLPETFHGLQPPAPARGRLSRAAMFAAGATLLGAAACSDDAMPMPLYGAPFDGSITGDASGGTGGTAAGGSGGTAAGGGGGGAAGAGGTAAGGRGGTSAGGAAGTTSSGAGGIGGAFAAYGTPPFDAGTTSGAGGTAAGGAGGTAAGGRGGSAAGGRGGSAAGGAAGTASNDAGSDRGAVALYGAAPIDATVGPAYGIAADPSLSNKS